MASKYAFIPIEVLRDERLTKIQLKVLCALYSFINHKKPEQKLFPKRNTIGERCGYGEQTVTKATKELEGLGWLEKANNSGGRSRGAVYYVRIPSHLAVVSEPNKATVETPKTLSDSARVSESKTLSNPARVSEPAKLTKPQLGAIGKAFVNLWEHYPFPKGDKSSALTEFIKGCNGMDEQGIDGHASEIIAAAKHQKALIGERLNALSTVTLSNYLRAGHYGRDSIDEFYLE